MGSESLNMMYEMHIYHQAFPHTSHGLRIKIIHPFIFREEDSSTFENEQKFIVFQSCLLELFKVCPICSGEAQASVKQVQATLVTIHQWCLDPDCQFQRTWFNEPFVRSMPVCNLLMSASILMSGTVFIVIIA